MNEYGFFNSAKHLGFPLESVAIEGMVMGEWGEIRQKQLYRNDRDDNQEIFYIFPLNHDAVITGFKAVIHGREIQGVIRERKKAEQEYAEAIMKGDTAMMLEEHRPNIFQISLGQILRGESVSIEISYMIPVTMIENEFELTLPMVVGPRYISGRAEREKTGPGTAEPTDQVPDADFITPPIGDAGYRASLNLKIETIGKLVSVESVSHPICTRILDQHQVELSFAQDGVRLDRDLKLKIKTSQEAAAYGRVYRNQQGELFVRAAFMPDLEAYADTIAPPSAHDYIFLLDVSGSMSGSKLEQAKRALRLCLRQLSSRDRFNLIAFESGFELMSETPIPFNQQSLDQADQWFDRQDTRGGTELLDPLKHILDHSAPDAVIVLFTDGDVGNDDSIIRYVRQHRQDRRFFTFGIDSAVNSYLLKQLADVSFGCAEFVFPHEKIESKVLHQFSRINSLMLEKAAIDWGNGIKADCYPRSIQWISHLEPVGIVAKLEKQFSSDWALTGMIQGHEVRFPITAAQITEDSPFVERLWAKTKLNHLENDRLALDQNRRGESYQEDIIALSTRYQILTRYTSFLAVYERQEKAGGCPVEIKVPVSMPADWTMTNNLNRYSQSQDSPLIFLGGNSSYLGNHKSKRHLRSGVGSYLSECFSLDNNLKMERIHDDISDETHHPWLDKNDIINDFALLQRADGSFLIDPYDGVRSSLLALLVLIVNDSQSLRQPIIKLIGWIAEEKHVDAVILDPELSRLLGEIIRRLRNLNLKTHHLTELIGQLESRVPTEVDSVQAEAWLRSMTDRISDFTTKTIVENLTSSMM